MKTQMIQDVKAVKNSVFLRESNGDYVALHYNSEIFRAGVQEVPYGESNAIVVKNLYVPSVTSSKMAKRCYEYVFSHLPDAKEWKQIKESFEQ